ncbi:hypothetical protein NDU88_007612 [Pleurodeles waltl]|uniref:Uncharacterized protein n=1 Tax=Pleurodeles waltl TaxID=8319 RepID=A0AAV7ST05_PLEWA|nr:hypothetical protein NDU88_007612 [Pleurodeles waltl]
MCRPPGASPSPEERRESVGERKAPKVTRALGPFLGSAQLAVPPSAHPLLPPASGVLYAASWPHVADTLSRSSEQSPFRAAEPHVMDALLRSGEQSVVSGPRDPT